MTQFSLRIEEDILARIDAEARKEKRDRSNMIRFMIESWFERHEKEERKVA
jgi:metal-responsive CopG/Arc/MetJ family transcriptional regulator